MISTFVLEQMAAYTNFANKVFIAHRASNIFHIYPTFHYII